jgi:hypothetical protein
MTIFYLLIFYISLCSSSFSSDNYEYKNLPSLQPNSSEKIDGTDFNNDNSLQQSALRRKFKRGPLRTIPLQHRNNIDIDYSHKIPFGRKRNLEIAGIEDKENIKSDQQMQPSNTPKASYHSRNELDHISSGLTKKRKLNNQPQSSNKLILRQEQEKKEPNIIEDITRSFFSTLPNELLLNIISFIRISDYQSVTSTCLKFQNFLEDKETKKNWDIIRTINNKLSNIYKNLQSLCDQPGRCTGLYRHGDYQETLKQISNMIKEQNPSQEFKEEYVVGLKEKINKLPIIENSENSSHIPFAERYEQPYSTRELSQLWLHIALLKELLTTQEFKKEAEALRFKINRLKLDDNTTKAFDMLLIS